ncbi:hypothetical protein TRVL_04672 [Trypanosoma vivax]|nr:hypothetical protein TRVL_04672 [Trypanosoma vivax]
MQAPLLQICAHRTSTGPPVNSCCKRFLKRSHSCCLCAPTTFEGHLSLPARSSCFVPLVPVRSSRHSSCAMRICFIPFPFRCRVVLNLALTCRLSLPRAPPRFVAEAVPPNKGVKCCAWRRLEQCLGFLFCCLLHLCQHGVCDWTRCCHCLK